MPVYELTHIFFSYDDTIIHSPKKLGFYTSADSANEAIQYYNKKPGFCDNPDAYSVRQRFVNGEITNTTVYEVIVYLHTTDYEFETAVELGLFSEVTVAENVLKEYCKKNICLVGSERIVAEQIINKCTLDKREWSEGFSVCGEVD